MSKSVEPLAMDLVPSVPANQEADFAAPVQSAKPRRTPVRRLIAWVASSLEWCFGVVSLIAILAVVATIPILNLLSLGYLLEVSGRIARTGKFSAGWIGIRPAARLGGVLLGTWLLLWPPRMLASLWYTAELIEPGGHQAQGLWLATLIVTLILAIHWVWACQRGGRLRHFLWPAPVRLFRTLGQPGLMRQSTHRAQQFLTSLRPGYYFWLGARGFAGTFLWLLLPIAWIIATRQLNHPGLAFLLSLPGLLALGWLVVYLPFLQTHFAKENRFSAIAALDVVKSDFRHAPLLYWVGLAATLLLAMPLYLLKIEWVDREIAWLPGLLFIVFAWPARMLCGWAVASARKRQQPAHWLWRYSSRLLALPVVLTYLLVTYLSLYVSWQGAYALLEQHAFLLPVPFFSG